MIRWRDRHWLVWTVLLIWAWFCMAAPFAHRHTISGSGRAALTRADSNGCETCSWTAAVESAQCPSATPPRPVESRKLVLGLPATSLVLRTPVSTPSRAPPTA